MENGEIALLTSVLVMLFIFIPAILILFKEFGQHLTIFDKLMILILTGVVIIPEFAYSHAIELLGVYMLWLSTRSPRIPTWVKLIPAYVFLFIDGYFGLLPIFAYIAVLPLLTLVLVCLFGFVSKGRFPFKKESFPWPI